MTQHSPIPTNIITGFLGVGKTTTIVNLLKQKPNNEKWAILVNEFGEIGLDGALIAAEHNEADKVFIREVPGGCMCCASGLPMQIALNMLIMKAKPDRLLIEPTGLGHPKEVLKVLSGEHYKDVLSLNNSITLVDARHFTSAKHLENDTFQQQLDVADLLVVNKSDLASDHDIKNFEAYTSKNNHLSTKPVLQIQHGKLDITNLQRDVNHSKTNDSAPPIHEHHGHSHASHSANPDGTEPQIPACGFLVKTHIEGCFTSVGWRIQANKRFVLSELLAWMKNLQATRIKALVHYEKGYISFNLNPDDNDTQFNEASLTPVTQQLTGENRLEVIFQDREISETTIRVWTDYLCR